MNGPNTIDGPLLHIQVLQKDMDGEVPAVSGLSKDTVLIQSLQVFRERKYKTIHQ